jgi:hypothetical protein
LATALSANRTTYHGLKPFDHAAEWARRARVERLWRRSKEEKGLRAKPVEAQMRKLKKAGRHLVHMGNTLVTAADSAAAGF